MEIVDIIVEYGYEAIIGLVFLQEIGFPTLISNELLVVAVGAYNKLGILSISIIPLIIVTEIIGTSLLYGLGRFLNRGFVKRILEKRKSSRDVLNRVKTFVSISRPHSVFFARFIPYLRGYASFFSGIIAFPFKRFFVYVCVAACLRTTALFILGVFLTPYIDHMLLGTRGVWYSIFWLSLYVLLIATIGKIVMYRIKPIDEKQ